MAKEGSLVSASSIEWNWKTARTSRLRNKSAPWLRKSFGKENRKCGLRPRRVPSYPGRVKALAEAARATGVEVLGGYKCVKTEKEEVFKLKARIWGERVVSINHIAKGCLKGGRRYRCNAVVVVGDKKGRNRHGNPGKAIRNSRRHQKSRWEGEKKNLIEVPVVNGAFPMKSSAFTEPGA